MVGHQVPSYDELVAAEWAVREVLERGAEAGLRAVPGVVHVSVGLKERAGRVTREHAIRVYVRERRPVFNVGAQTGRTAGHVVDPNFPSFSITSHGTAAA